MKKTKLLIPLVAAALSVLSGCGGNGGGKSSKKDPNCVDKLLGKLIENSGITYDIPKMPDSNSWDAKLIYSENAECYIVEASCSDSRGTKEKDLKKAFDESEWNCVNDSENTYEDYGYCYGDAKKQKDCKFEIDFCSFDGDFYLYAYDWGNTYTGSELDSDLNPLPWYWQYEQEGLEYTDTWFSKDFVNESLGVSLSSFPSITLEKGMLAGAFEAIDDEYGSQPAYIAATILDDSTSKLLDAFKGDGWVVEEIEDKIQELENIINEYRDGKIISDGIKTVIVGRPNVGKSSLLNRLLNQEKAIVTDIPGTTRDIVEGDILIDGIRLNMIDTAGIRNTFDTVEQIGVNKSLENIKEADLVLLLLNNNEELTGIDKDLIEATESKTTIIVVNKNDLETNLDVSSYGNRDIVYINTLNNEGIIALKNKIKELFNLERIDKSDFNYITNARQIAKIKECLNSVNDIIDGLENDLPLDMIEIDLKSCWETLGAIIGETYSEELLDQLFSKFCVGK